jgi:hypothetical protein
MDVNKTSEGLALSNANTEWSGQITNAAKKCVTYLQGTIFNS